MLLGEELKVLSRFLEVPTTQSVGKYAYYKGVYSGRKPKGYVYS